MDVVITVAAWLMFASFLGLLLWDVIRGKPTRVYAIKKGMNTIARVSLSIGLLLGVAILIVLTPFILDFFTARLVFPLPPDGGSLNIAALSSYFWVCFLTLFPLWFFLRILDVTVFPYSRAELQWQSDQKSRQKEEGAKLRSKIRTFFSRRRPSKGA